MPKFWRPQLKKSQVDETYDRDFLVVASELGSGWKTQML